MSAMASQIPGVSIVYSTVGSGADERKHQSSAFVAFKKTLIPLEYIDIKDGVPHGSV